MPRTILNHYLFVQCFGVLKPLEPWQIAALSSYLTWHINRFGRYDLDTEKQPPELLYDLWTHESQILMAKK